MSEESVRCELSRASGRDLVGVFAFGDSPAMADLLLGWILLGSKRATAGSVDETDEPAPEPGTFWGVLDGAGRGRLVIETVNVSTGPLGSVTPAFAWDEGEDDRTRDSWLVEHRRFFVRVGVPDPDAHDVTFERFRVVWPEPDPLPGDAVGAHEVPWADRAAVAARMTGRLGGTEIRLGERWWPAADLPALAHRGPGGPAWLPFLPVPGDVLLPDPDLRRRLAGPHEAELVDLARRLTEQARTRRIEQ